MSRFKLLGKDLLSYGVMGGISRSMHIVLLPVLTRRFSVAEYGVVDIIATMTSLLTLVMALTLQSGVARAWFEARKVGETKELVSSTLVFVGVFGGVILAGIWFQSDAMARLILDDPGAGEFIVVGTFAALFSALVHVPQTVLRMERRIPAYTVVSVIQTLGFAVIALVLILPVGMGVEGVFIAQVLGSALALIVGLWTIREHVGMNWSTPWLQSSLAFSLPLFPAVVVSKVNKYLDRILLLTFIGISGVGVFAAAARVAAVVTLLVDIFRQAWTPLAIALIDEEEGRDQFYRRALNYYAGGLTLVALVMSAFAKELMGLIVPPEYVYGYVIIPWLIGAQIIHGSALFTSLGMLLSKRTLGNSKAAWTGAVVNILSGLLLIPWIGIWGAAIGGFVSGLVFTSLTYRYSVAVAGLRLDVGRIIAIITCYVASCGTFTALSATMEVGLLSIGIRLAVLIVASGVVLALSIDASAVTAVRTHGWRILQRRRSPRDLVGSTANHDLP